MALAVFVRAPEVDRFVVEKGGRFIPPMVLVAPCEGSERNYMNEKKKTRDENKMNCPLVGVG